MSRCESTQTPLTPPRGWPQGYFFFSLISFIVELLYSVQVGSVDVRGGERTIDLRPGEPTYGYLAKSPTIFADRAVERDVIDRLLLVLVLPATDAVE